MKKGWIEKVRWKIEECPSTIVYTAHRNLNPILIINEYHVQLQHTKWFNTQILDIWSFSGLYRYQSYWNHIKQAAFPHSQTHSNKNKLVLMIFCVWYVVGYSFDIRRIKELWVSFVQWRNLMLSMKNLNFFFASLLELRHFNMLSRLWRQSAHSHYKLFFHCHAKRRRFFLPHFSSELNRSKNAWWQSMDPLRYCSVSKKLYKFHQPEQIIDLKSISCD